MDEKNIVLFEKHDGVRFVLEKSLEKYEEHVSIFSSHWHHEVQQWLKDENVDLFITELNPANPFGIELSQYAREINPNLQILWISILGCNLYCDLRKSLGNVRCIEKPLEIEVFRHNVLHALDLLN